MNPEPAATSTYEKGNLYQISIADFKPDPDQPRKVIDPDALAELAARLRSSALSSRFCSARRSRDGFISSPANAATWQQSRSV
jgi:hypothetical protein